MRMRESDLCESGSWAVCDFEFSFQSPDRFWEFSACMEDLIGIDLFLRPN